VAICPSDLSKSEWRLLSFGETAYFVLSFASLTPLRKVEKGPQLIVVSIVVIVVVAVAVAIVALEEERMACLDQKHFGRKEQVAVVVVEG